MVSDDLPSPAPPLPPAPPPAPTPPSSVPVPTPVPLPQGIPPGLVQGNVVVSYQRLPSNSAAAAGMVFGIVSLIFTVIAPLFFFFCCFLSIPMALIGVAFSHAGLSNSRTSGVGNGQAVAGLILNYIQIVPFALLMLLVLLGITSIPEV